MNENTENQYPYQDMEKFGHELAQLIDISKNNHPHEVGHMLVHIGCNIFHHCAPSTRIAIGSMLKATQMAIDDALDEDS